MPPQPCVVAGDEPRCACAPREREQLVEAERPVATSARVRRVPAFVRADELVDDRAAEFLPEVERHVRETEAVTRSARGSDGIGRAAGTFGVGRLGIDPEPERDTDRVAVRLATAPPRCRRHRSSPLPPATRPEQRGRQARSPPPAPRRRARPRRPRQPRAASGRRGPPRARPRQLRTICSPRTRRRTAAQSPFREASPKSSVMR